MIIAHHKCDLKSRYPLKHSGIIQIAQKSLDLLFPEFLNPFRIIIHTDEFSAFFF